MKQIARTLTDAVSCSGVDVAVSFVAEISVS